MWAKEFPSVVGMVQDAQLVMGEVLPQAFQPAKGQRSVWTPYKNPHCVQQASRQTIPAGAIEHLENLQFILFFPFCACRLENFLVQWMAQ